MSPYVVTTKRASATRTSPPNDNDLLSRRAVATLEAREVSQRLYGQPPGHYHHPLTTTQAYVVGEIMKFPESGGTIGPLPDGTVIEVEQATWVYLAMEARRRDPSGYRLPPLPVVEASQGDERAQQAIRDAFNARQS